MQQLSEADAAFLQFEKESAPMHSGGFYLFDNSAHRKPFTYEDFCRYLNTRLHMARIFRQRLIEVPGNIDLPYWVDDPDFDLRNHVSRITLPPTATWRILKNLSAVIYSHPLNRTRPLWEIKFIDGLEHIEGLTNRHFALVIKVHHSTLDASTGKQILTALLSPFPGIRPLKRVPSWHPDPLPSASSLVGRSYNHLSKWPSRLFKHGRKKAVRSSQALMERFTSALGEQRPSAPDSVLNIPVSASRSFEEVSLSLDKVKGIKDGIKGVTFNDVVLAICSGALRSYLLARDALPRQSLVGMTPISMKADNLASESSGNMSAMLVSLATDLDDPMERLERIHKNATQTHAFKQGINARALMDHLPSSTVALASRFYAEVRHLEDQSPPFNLAITNVPGPEIPLYLSGAKLIRQTGLGPVMDGLALALVIISYNGRLSIGITACPRAVPDLDTLPQHFRSSLNQLYQISLQTERQINLGHADANQNTAVGKVIHRLRQVAIPRANTES
jgi:WS/DGAT/MGAT family acyltransferase